MVGVAVKVIEDPAHIVCEPPVTAIVTDGVNNGLTVTTILLLVAVVGDAQVAVLVITQLTLLPLVNVVVV